MKRALILILSLTALFGFTPILGASSQDERFLDKLQHDGISYFVGESNSRNGLIKDSSRPGAPSSIAAVGFGLVALCVGESRGWCDKDDVYNRVLGTLTTFRDVVQNEHGFFYHFLNMRTARRAWNSEASSIDTALFLAGALFCGEYFKGTEIEEVSRELYERVDWNWMLNEKDVLCMGWKPESGFLEYYWDSYSEAMILYALAIGSPTHPIPSQAWFEWKRPVGSYKDFELVYCTTGSLFTYQYAHAWIDFRALYEGDVNYYTNSVKATGANRQFCIDNSDTYKTYGENSWGLTASIGPGGYRGYGAKPGEAINDGTIAPCGMGGAIAFSPVESLKGLKYLYSQYKDFLYGKYGFKDAFNIDKGWWAEEYLGIDVGITVLMIENYRSSLIWKKFMKLKPIRKWISECLTESTNNSSLPMDQLKENK